MKRFQLWIFAAIFSLIWTAPAWAAVDVTVLELRTFAATIGSDDLYGVPEVQATDNGVVLQYQNASLELTVFTSPAAAEATYAAVYGNSTWVEAQDWVFHRNGNLGYRAESSILSTAELRALIEGRQRYLGVLFPPRIFDFELGAHSSSALLKEGASLVGNGLVSFDFYFENAEEDAGVLIDSRGAQTPDAGDFTIRLDSDGRLNLSFYAPLYAGSCGMQEGFVRVDSVDSAEAYTWNHLELRTGVEGLNLKLNGREILNCSVEQALDDGPVYLGLHPKATVGIATFKGYVKSFQNSASFTQNGERVDDILARQVFLDLSVGDADLKAFRLLKDRGIFLGSQGNVNPEAVLNRAGLVKILLKSHGIAVSDGNEPFVDVGNSDWFFGPVVTAYERGIVKGVDDTHFAPSQEVTRGEFFTMLARMSGKKWTYVKGYKDVENTDWFSSGAAYALANGLNKDSRFDAGTGLTRREAARVLYALAK